MDPEKKFTKSNSNEQIPGSNKPNNLKPSYCQPQTETIPGGGKNSSSVSPETHYPKRFKGKKPNTNMSRRSTDLLKLHVPEEDTNIRRCLKVYTILPRFCENPNERNENAKQVMAEVLKVGRKMKKKIWFKVEICLGRVCPK